MEAAGLGPEFLAKLYRDLGLNPDGSVREIDFSTPKPRFHLTLTPRPAPLLQPEKHEPPLFSIFGGDEQDEAGDLRPFPSLWPDPSSDLEKAERIIAEATRRRDQLIPNQSPIAGRHDEILNESNKRRSSLISHDVVHTDNSTDKPRRRFDGLHRYEDR